MIYVYVRTGFWSADTGNGSEHTPYARDVASVLLSQQYFRGREIQDLGVSDVAELVRENVSYDNAPASSSVAVEELARLARSKLVI